MFIYNMSKHLVEINFDELKFNLYELLAVPQDASERKIKKAYRKLIIKFHPDKNNLIDEEIYNHLTIANQVLTNERLRVSYDDWLKSFGQDGSSHSDLKQNYNDTIKSVKSQFPSMPSEAKLSYHEKVNKLNEKHGFNQDFDSESTINKYNRKKKELEEGIHINQNIRNKKEFNSKFNNYKIDDVNSQEIIKSDGKIVEYNQTAIGNDYMSVKDYNLLYSEDSIQGNNYSSLDSAFKLQPKMEFVEEDVNKKMKDYKKLSNDLSTLPNSNN